eukprot:TRINITY_DN8739_c0_g1_i1.p1 TRINITY_DN8739_c0_g1~~TRINITY_DN8739_c0_g1_i1.p1  ORF type:complete len:470 (-),score=60.92 TRINITY_DN8739_c0_g1_i1:156-1565(-)
MSESGTIEVRIVQARLSEPCDPYVKAFLQGHKADRRKTKKRKKTAEPIWEETFLFKCKNIRSDILIVNLFDRRAKRGVVATVSVPVFKPGLVRNRELVDWFPLADGTITGEIKLGLKPLDYGTLAPSLSVQEPTPASPVAEPANAATTPRPLGTALPGSPASSGSSAASLGLPASPTFPAMSVSFEGSLGRYPALFAASQTSGSVTPRGVIGLESPTDLGSSVLLSSSALSADSSTLSGAWKALVGAAEMGTYDGVAPQIFASLAEQGINYSDNMIAEIRTVLHMGNFYGFSNAADCKRFLDPEAIGTYLIRCSSIPFYIVLENVISFQTINSMRVEVTRDSFSAHQQYTFPAFEKLASFWTQHYRVPFVSEIPRAPWWHGAMPIEAASSMIGRSPPGSFLVRFGSPPGSYSFAWKSDDGERRHALARRVGKQYVIDGAEDGPFNSLSEALDAYKMRGILRTPLPRKPG